MAKREIEPELLERWALHYLGRYASSAENLRRVLTRRVRRQSSANAQVAARLIDSPTFCHGVSGLLQITLRFARDTGLPAFADAAAELTGQLLDLYEPDTLTGYRNIEPEDRRVDNPGLLDGAPGVMMTMLAAATEQEPVWDRAFLLG